MPTFVNKIEMFLKPWSFANFLSSFAETWLKLNK